jgi:hypothetical protein
MIQPISCAHPEYENEYQTPGVQVVGRLKLAKSVRK